MIMVSTYYRLWDDSTYESVVGAHYCALSFCKNNVLTKFGFSVNVTVS